MVRCYATRPTPQEFIMYMTHLAVVVIAYSFLWDAVGRVAAIALLSPFLFALVMGPCVRPGPCNMLIASALVFMLLSMWSRCILVACRHQWEAKMIRDTKQGEFVMQARLGRMARMLKPKESLAETTQAEATRDQFDRRIRKFCNATYADEELPRFFPLYRPPPGMMSKELRDSVFRMKCPRWMCTFTEQHSRSGWGFLATLGVLGIAQVLYVFFPCPKCCECLNEYFGFGRCRKWWAWVWVWFVPMWLVAAVTFLKNFDYGNLSELLLSLLDVGLEDLYRVLCIAGICVCALLVYLNLGSIKKALGIDDRYIVHYSTLSGRTDTSESFQVCVWRVDGNQRAYRSLTDEGRLDVKTLKTTSSLLDRLFVCRARDEDEEDKLLPQIGVSCNLFVRLAYGDNEPQCSRVVRMRSNVGPETVVSFQEVFILDLETDPDRPASLYIEVCDQAFLGKQELGRVVLDLQELRSELQRTRSKRDHEGMMSPSGESKRAYALVKGPGNDPELLLPAEQQAMQMMRCEPGLGLEEEQMYLMGFKPWPLSTGGTIWLAFAEAPRGTARFNEDEDKCCEGF
mmetsp:Transcript_79588/g.170666  ORF Transcript_79588/g.170666 Transcript_79588/m.170666 type:complete len:570 (-) Transcript_79588:71-1780(-)